LKHRLHVVEDPALISLLGRPKFVDMVVFGAVGWQPGVSHIFFPFLLKIMFLLAFIAPNCLLVHTAFLYMSHECWNSRVLHSEF
jgi:hypothetical protein